MFESYIENPSEFFRYISSTPISDIDGLSIAVILFLTLLVTFTITGVVKVLFGLLVAVISSQL